MDAPFSRSHRRDRHGSEAQLPSGTPPLSHIDSLDASTGWPTSRLFNPQARSPALLTSHIPLKAAPISSILACHHPKKPLTLSLQNLQANSSHQKQASDEAKVPKVLSCESMCKSTIPPKRQEEGSSHTKKKFVERSSFFVASYMQSCGLAAWNRDRDRWALFA